MSEDGKKSGLFLSYRREDSAGYTGRLYDCLSQRFGADQVFMDFNDIRPGDDFARVIEQGIGACQVLLVVIGKKWLKAVDAQGRSRLKDRKDFVRLEILAALKRNVRVIPVLVGGATLPSPRELPRVLAPLIRRQAFEIRDAHFHQDAATLIAALEPTLGTAAPAKTDRGKDEVVLDLNGHWDAEGIKEGQAPFHVYLTLEVMGERLFGTVSYPTGTTGLQEGKLEQGSFSFMTRHVPRFAEQESTTHWQGKVVGEELQGIFQSGDSYAKFKAHRIAEARRYGWQGGG